MKNDTAIPARTGMRAFFCPIANLENIHEARIRAGTDAQAYSGKKYVEGLL